ncbi:MAG: GNAT family N-acetyltransferase [Xenococcaceae cyanobacterium MO_234.B1]|nr:GNAT family N-acetyltransferase [Xenococcaceae cyanobacterium MO_234.B1]
MFVLETERLKLRPLTLDDAEKLYQLCDGDPKVWKFDPGYARSLDERIEVMERRIQEYQIYGFGCFGIEHKPDLTLIGLGGLSPHEFENQNGNITDEFEIMYKLGRAYWGQGYATEASQAWIKYGFEIASLKRLVVCPHKANTASIRVLEKLGFSIEDDWLEPESVLAFLDNPKVVA